MRTFVPMDFPVQPTTKGGPNIATDGTCGLSWDDSVSTSMTPAPSGRCPFEYFHGNVDDHLKVISKEAGPLMREVVRVLLDRETITYHAVLELTSGQLYELYESHVGPAIDAVEDQIGDVVEFDEAYPNMLDAYRHLDGSISYIVPDEDGEHVNPRNNDGNVSTLIQVNHRCIDIDHDDEGLREAHERFTEDGALDLMRRYLAIYRPDILHYDDNWSAGDSHGWGYVTRESWERWMGADYSGDVTPEQAFDQEVDVYRQWANGEVYGCVHVTKQDDDSVWGFLAYDDHKDIAKQFTESPIIDTLY